jgi:A/G-specific adenine glycosylase
LCAWFAGAGRPLPWRERYDPYEVWVAEMMLQQTQVEAVIPFFRRWMARFPDVAAVAAAPEEEVLKAWEGLGYYRRARNLHEAARRMVADHGGRVPADLEALRALPGIGRYTAGAVLSIGFDRAAPIVDGNVGRVLSRLFALPDAARSSAGEARLWELAEALLPSRAPRAFNQGLMELGALVCRPQAPRCGECPLRRWCRARALGSPERFPAAPLPKARPVREGSLLLLHDGAGRLLLRKRPAGGLWVGLWEPPWTERSPAEGAPAAARRLLTALALSPLGGLRRRGRVVHGLTHLELRLACYAAQVQATAGHALPSGNGASAWQWAGAAALAELPMARLGRKALAIGGDIPAGGSRTSG